MNEKHLLGRVPEISISIKDHCSLSLVPASQLRYVSCSKLFSAEIPITNGNRSWKSRVPWTHTLVLVSSSPVLSSTLELVWFVCGRLLQLACPPCRRETIPLELCTSVPTWLESLSSSGKSKVVSQFCWRFGKRLHGHKPNQMTKIRLEQVTKQLAIVQIMFS